MDVKVRDICRKCCGTGKNALTYADAIDMAESMPRGGVIMPGQFGATSVDQRARDMQKCGYCDGGYNERWVSFDALMSLVDNREDK